MQILIPYEIKQDVNFLQEQWQAHRDSPASVSAVPLDWMAQFPATNGYLAGIVRNLPVGYSYDNVKLVTDLANC
jgi:hypothetical protein